ncbi:MAG: penicillin-binding protein activator, partial [Thiomicrorhabdus sp.]|nr:penicillin-binding protein activator [Thiomicrorhabdus sp.]
EGKYKVVANQIRSGIIKAFFASSQEVTLKFYDTSIIENVEATYNLAKEEGADRIIGPLTKEAIQQIAGFQDDNMLALNTINNNSITQFSFKSAEQSQQMLQRFIQSNFKRVGILTNDNPHSLTKASELQQTLLAYKDSAVLSIYPDQNPKLRQALGELIHENLSKERHNNLRWLIGEKLDFFPRTRQDLDAIVIFDNAHRMAVFRPQFDFFELDTPLYGDSELTPKNFQEIPANRDLNRVSFLTYPAVLNPNDLTSAFEAFGWDSFQVTMQLENLKKGACLTSAKTGILSLENNQIKQQLLWVQYDKTGVLAEAPSVELKRLEKASQSIRDSDSE